MRDKFKDFVYEIYKAITRREMAILPGNLAFFLVLALIPTFTLLVYIASLFSISIDMVVSLINKVLPTEAADVVVGIISGKGFDSSVTVFVILAIVVANNGTYALVRASNSLYKCESDNELKNYIKSFIILIVIMLLFLFLLVVPIFGNNILELIKYLGGSNKAILNTIFVFNICKWPLTFLIIYFNVKLLYTMSVSKKISSSSTTIGALLTTFLWIIATYIFTYYLGHFARYDMLYGNLSSIIILMMWIYMLCYIFVLGIAINSTRYNNMEEDLKRNDEDKN